MRGWMVAAALAGLVGQAWGQEPGGCGMVYASYPAEVGTLDVRGPEIVERGPLVLAGIEQPIAGSTMDLQIDVLWTRFEQWNQWIANPESAQRTGVCLNGGANSSFDFFVGQVLDGPAGELPDVYSTLELPAARYGVFVLTGSAGDIVGAQALVYRALLAQAGLKAADAPDLVVLPPGFSPAKRDAWIELWVPLAP